MPRRILRENVGSGWDSAAFGIVGNVYNSPSYGAVGNTVCRMWESCPLFLKLFQTGNYREEFIRAIFHKIQYNIKNFFKEDKHEKEDKSDTKYYHGLFYWCVHWLRIIGVFYVLANHGQVNAGYAVVPGIWTMICFGYYRSKKQG